MAAPAREHRRLRVLATRAGRSLAGAEPVDVLRWADAQFGGSLAIATSMADAVLAHLATIAAPRAKLVFLDTGYHFTETVATRDAVAASLPLEVLTVSPRQTVEQQDAEHGARLYERDPDRCCALRKVAPLTEALAPFTAWASGVRRDESFGRRDTAAVAWDERRGMVKVNPLAFWSEQRVAAYIADNDILVNPLTARGYPSIGCAPCTRRVASGDHPRSGRWFGQTKTECGLHA
ncbi:phosphoadenylyl-sulfate reductase [soil metagenome]